MTRNRNGFTTAFNERDVREEKNQLEKNRRRIKSRM